MLLLKIFFLLDLFLVSFCSGSVSGYYVKLLHVPAICPLTDFCWPWNPATNSKGEEISLISNPVLSISLTHFEFPTTSGRLKNNFAACLARRRRAEVKQKKTAVGITIE
jgi:hypothetical protein